MDNKNRKPITRATVYRMANFINVAHTTSSGIDHTYIDQDITVSASPTFANVSVPSDGKVYFEGVSGDTYITFNSTSGDIEIYKNGTKVVSW